MSRPSFSGALTSAVVGLATGGVVAAVIDHYDMPIVPAIGAGMLGFAAAWLLLGTLNRLGMLR